MENYMTIQDFLNYLRFEKHFSDHTSKCYGADLQQFTKFLVSQGSSSDSAVATQEQSGTAVALAEKTQVNINQLLLEVNVDSVRSFMAFLREKQCIEAFQS